MKQSKGFSLIELLIAIGIIGILSTIAAFSWNRYVTNTNLRTATRDVASDIILLKARAVSESRQYRITFNVGANNYAVEQWNIGTGVYDIIQTKSPTAFGSDIFIDVTTFVGDRVTFLPRGTLSGVGGTVRLKNSRNSKTAIIVNITGKTRVELDDMQ